MVYIIKKENKILRAFSSYDDAVTYKDIKKKILHEHCCVCEGCSVSYCADHDRHDYSRNWEIVNVSLEKCDNIGELLFLVCKERKIEKALGKYEEAKAYIEEEEAEQYYEEYESTFVEPWDIKVCKYSTNCLYQDNDEDIEEYKNDDYYRYNFKGREIDNDV